MGRWRVYLIDGTAIEVISGYLHKQTYDFGIGLRFSEKPTSEKTDYMFAPNQWTYFERID